MKALIVSLVVGSLTLNLALATIIFAGRTSSGAPISAETPDPIEAVSRSSPSLDAEVWNALNPDDLPSLVQRLRERGYPTSVIRAIINARLRETFAARFRALDPSADSRSFWLSGTADGKMMQAQRQLSRDYQKAVRDLLGEDAEDSEMNALYRGQRFDSVPPSKLADVRTLMREFEDRRADIFTATTSSVEQARRRNALDQEQRAALAGILTPQEFEEFQLRNSDTARQVRFRLSAFDPTEDEFRAIYRYQAEFDAQFGTMYSIPSTDEQQRRAAAQKQMNEQIKATLGPVRGAEFERASDYQFQQTSQLISRLELPPETTTQVWSVKKEIEDRANAIRRDQAIPMPDRIKQLAALADEATTKIAPLIGGSRGMEAYRQYGGTWLQNLVPREAPQSSSGTIMRVPIQ